MTKTLTITLPDALEQALAQTAAQTNQSTEELVLQLLALDLLSQETPAVVVPLARISHQTFEREGTKGVKIQSPQPF